MNKNLKYGLIFGGVALGSFLLVKIIQNLPKKGDDTGDDVTPPASTSGSGTKNTDPNLPSFSKILAASNNKDFKASVAALQKVINRKLIGIAKQGEFITEDGWYGENTYLAHVKVMPFAVKDIQYVVANPTKAGVDSFTKFLNK